MEMAAVMEGRKQLMQISVIGPLYISNLFIQKQKHLAAKQPKPVQPKKPSISATSKDEGRYG